MIANPLLSTIQPLTTGTAVGVSGSGNLGSMTALSDFTDSISPYTSSTGFPEFEDDIITARIQRAELMVDAHYGGSKIFLEPHELTTWRRTPQFVPVGRKQSLIRDEAIAIQSISKQFTDPVIQALHISLFRAGYLVQETRPGKRRPKGSWYIADIKDSREGIEIVQILNGHTPYSGHDIIDLIRKVDWGDYRPTGFKDINASFRTIGQIERYQEKYPNADLERLKDECAIHPISNRLTKLANNIELLYLLEYLYSDNIPATQKEKLALIQAFTEPELISRLIIETAIAVKYDPSLVEKQNIFYCQMGHLFFNQEFINENHRKPTDAEITAFAQDRLNSMSRYDYSILRNQILFDLWNRLEGNHDNTVSSFLTSIKTAKDFEDLPPDKLRNINLADHIRNLKAELATMCSLLPEDIAATLKALRIAKFLASLASVITQIQLRTPPFSEQENTKLCIQALNLLGKELRQCLDFARTNAQEHTNGFQLTNEDILETLSDTDQLTHFTHHIDTIIQWTEAKIGMDSSLRYTSDLKTASLLFHHYSPFTMPTPN